MTLTTSVLSALFDDENTEIPAHAALTFHEVKAAGTPSQPLDFPKPTVHRAHRYSTFLIDHRVGNVFETMILSQHDQQSAYCFKKNLAKTSFGSVKLCVVLRKRNHKKPVLSGNDAEWITTEELVVIKASSLAKMRQKRGIQAEDPRKGKGEIWNDRFLVTLS